MNRRYSTTQTVPRAVKRNMRICPSSSRQFGGAAWRATALSLKALDAVGGFKCQAQQLWASEPRAVLEALASQRGCGLLDRLIALQYSADELNTLTLDRKTAALPNATRLAIKPVR
jgi:hypothetical protein